MKKRPRVALLIESSNSYARGLLRGIHAYIREHDGWATYLPEQGRGDAPPPWLNEKWQGDGIIARIENQHIAQVVQRTGLPVIDVSSGNVAPDVPRVITNGQSVARLAAEHLAERGLDHFGFVSDDRFEWSLRRGDQFAKIIEDMGFSCDVLGAHKPVRVQPDWDQEERAMTAWLRRLPKPVGVMACHDMRGLQVVQVCRRIGLAIPDEVAVVGVDNDEILCGLSTPPLSSVIQDTYRIGFEAAQMLDQWIAGREPPLETLIEPLGMVTRQSSDVLAVSDPEISKALRFIRDHACDGIRVEDVLRNVSVSRRIFEHRFKKLLGHTPHDEISKLQFQRAKQLLAETSLPLSVVAQRVGFQHAEYLSVAFKRRFGMSPSEYREEHLRQ
jgi:LacI family transcriptional regulator